MTPRRRSSAGSTPPATTASICIPTGIGAPSEFRYYPSVLDQPEELMQWIIFTQFLVEWGAGRRPELDYVSKPNKWLNTLYKIYLGAGMMDHIRFPGGPEGIKVDL